MDERTNIDKRLDDENDTIAMGTAERRNPLRYNVDDAAYPTDSPEVPDFASGDDHQDIRDEIEETRAEMTGTIDAIQERLDPATLMNQAKDSAREATIGKAERMVSDAGDSARDAGNSIVDTLKQNPVPTAMVAFGVGWLWTHRRNSSITGQEIDRRQTGYYGAYDRDRPYRQTNSWQYRTYDKGMDSDRIRRTANQAQDMTGQAASQVQDRAGQMMSQAQGQIGEWGDQAQGQMNRWGDQAQGQIQRVRGEFDHLLQENPLGVATVALGLGAVAGLMVPETRQENQWMGEKRDEMLDQAQDRARDMAQDTVEKVQQVAGKAQDAAKQEAQQQGLTSSDG